MVYVGSWLRAVGFDGPDPALIDVRLPVAGPPDWSGLRMDYWPSYSEIAPVSRAAYLEWLAGGRRDPRAYIGYVFLFFYGLERRVLVDCAAPGPARSDLPAIRAEVERLLSLYGGNHSFRGYAQGFLDVLDVYSGGWPAGPPLRTAERWSVPLALRRGLGRFAADGAPVPADWALAWAWFHPEIYPRTPARRCAVEYERLFVLRYHERYGDGIRVRPNKAAVRLEYNPASAGLPFTKLDLRLPDVFQLAGPAKKLAALADECADALDAYSRWLGRNPDERGTLPAAALLPRELVDTDTGPVAGLFAWAGTQLGDGVSTVVEAEELIAHWPADARTKTGKLAKKDAIALAQLLGHGGFGIEPDPRVSGALPVEGPMVLFRGGAPTAVASGTYAAASALLHLAVAVSQADGDVTEAERQQLLTHVETGLDLSDAERVRLRAHLRWLLAAGAKLTAVKRRLADLSADHRTRIGEFLVTVAAADGTIAAAEVTILNRIYGLLGLNPDDVYTALHAAAVPTPPAIHPVTVRPATPGPIGYAIPRPGPAETASGAEVRLDPTLVAQKIAETAEVGSLLGSIFTEDDEPPPQPPLAAAEPGIAAVTGLDLPHSGLLRALAEKNPWTRAEFEELAAGWGLLPDGAVDALNDAAYETAGDPVVEGEDPIEINNDVLGEMLP